MQNFVANEYVSACGDSGTSYEFECNAGDANGEYDVITNLSRKESWFGTTYTYNNLTKDSHHSRMYFHPCKETHITSIHDDFESGYMVYSGGYDNDIDWCLENNQYIPVVIWTNGGTDVHCTTVLDEHSWKVTKS